jgi:L-Ala-D/L-Glu epimerase / N-acetyl-D-glutamate racemase
VAAAKVREAGDFEILKVKMGGDDDRAVLEAVRDVTDRPLWVDANEGWTLEGARSRLDWLQTMGVELVEQPLPASQLAETRELRRTSPLPIFADESLHVAADVPRLAGAFDGINVKLMKCGGIGEALRMIAAARAHGMKVMLGCMVETSLAITAAAHLSPLVDYADLDGNLLIQDDPFVGARVAGGRLVLPDGPGLGVQPTW